MSVMEMSHRNADFTSIHEAALADLRVLLNVPESHRILFMQGGGIGENAIVPLNLLHAAECADYVVTGTWSRRSFEEAHKYCAPRLVAQTTSDYGHIDVPPVDTWDLSTGAAYLHLCTNETIDGVEMFTIPEVTPVPVVADVSSHILSRPMNVSACGVLYAGAQKNIGIAGVTVVIVREDLLDRAMSICPSAFEWKTIASHNSMYNTPPTYAIYIAGLVFKWLKQQGGLTAMEARNMEKSKLLYDVIDSSNFYINRIAHPFRSRMNVPFHLANEARNEAFLDGAKTRGLLQLKGHKLVGGMRASIYNALPLDGVELLVQYMKEFEQEQA